ncbi:MULTISPECIES: PRC-barrel domain-containing protein [unclassified Candidatus Frackibacter]|uniref:PRC-barrel domain-containing protein n=1 Tax=unclassified Candidatus Frackibacter TaxID=2648818 RepID=UPI000791F7F0|nr:MULTISPECIES: PRC-barrel domain-containing protein [unclassified Candidatus Frackibacter]KXS42492.1 MAG: PRC-barrel domain-containing protein [Candidatus Frackibacter sp. T328-2]SDC86548.1 Uncharacterized protein YrrD, contains PRC-barrel domain [Candidatus Frackibacter sp. WG11]SEN00796.1 Uncharacterized protein YrrD, contains PRC-barrel domain [Candidatus Frackibacter sp. WG12]SFM08620.1 Uncharacterized protein YrrD, contains PRC-barrel domain [Candidatus Frackibacter sp. WG13]
MHKGYEIIDLPVINLQTGEEIGAIEDVVFDPEEKRIVGLIINNKSLFQGSRMIAYEELHSVGEDAVTIEDDSVLTKLDDTKEFLTGPNGSVIGSRVVTDDGKELGNIEDIILDSTNGQINGYEITDGLVQDILDGRGRLQVSDDLKYGKDVVIVSNLDNYQRINNRDNNEE